MWCLCFLEDLHGQVAGHTGHDVVGMSDSTPVQPVLLGDLTTRLTLDIKTLFLVGLIRHPRT
jgi:hypothetical protein